MRIVNKKTIAPSSIEQMIRAKGVPASPLVIMAALQEQNIEPIRRVHRGDKVFTEYDKKQVLRFIDAYVASIKAKRAASKPVSVLAKQYPQSQLATPVSGPTIDWNMRYKELLTEFAILKTDNAVLKEKSDGARRDLANVSSQLSDMQQRMGQQIATVGRYASEANQTMQQILAIMTAPRKTP